MRIFQNVPGKLDNRPTTASWPKPIHEISDLPPVYQPFILKYTSRGMNITNAVYQEKARGAYFYASEYVITWFEGQVILFVLRDQVPEETVIRPADITKIVRYEKLLYSELEIHFSRDARDVTCRISYNTAREELFHPVMGLLFAKDCSIPLAAMAEKDSTYGHLQLPTLAMTNLKVRCWQLCDRIYNYVYFTKKERSPVGGRKKIFGEFFVAKTDRGFCMISKEDYFITTAYYFQNHIRKSYIEKKQFKGTLFLLMTTGTEKIELEKLPENYEQF